MAYQTDLSHDDAILVGMVPAVMARDHPGRIALKDGQGNSTTFHAFNARVNQIVRALRQRGLGAEEAIAILAPNCFEFVEVYAAAMRGGFRITPINWHLKADEAIYVATNCEARAILCHDRFADVAMAVSEAVPADTVKLCVGQIDGFEPFDEAIAPHSGEDLRDPVKGHHMLYTSGTTGRPKGVYRKPVIGPSAVSRTLRSAFGVKEGDVYLMTGPAYHAAPISVNINSPLEFGATIVMMDRFDAEACLRLIEEHRVSVTHFVATMFHRLLQLPEETRARYDLSSLRGVLHGAAPTPPETKHAMLDWLGPVIWEYYGGTEGTAFIISPQDWLAHPGSVGKVSEGQVVQVWDEDGNVLPAGEVGTVYFKTSPDQRFVYHGDPEKTETAYCGGFFTLGDMGYFDEKGFLYLSGRTAELIISGGANIYPTETDNALQKHPAVHDVVTVGVPNPEWGEEVKSVVQLRAGFEPSDQLEQDLIAFAREQIAHFKAPRSIEFWPELPRREDGKILRHEIKAMFQGN